MGCVLETVGGVTAVSEVRRMFANTTPLESLGHVSKAVLCVSKAPPKPLALERNKLASGYVRIRQDTFALERVSKASTLRPLSLLCFIVLQSKAE